MKLVTVATKSERYFPDLEYSAKRHGHDFVKLGWGEAWRGFGWKLRLIKDYLETLPPDEITCFIDGYDVIVLQGPDVIERNFKELIGDRRDAIVISSEVFTKDFINTAIIKTWTTAWSYKCKNTIINAGTYIGYAGSILRILKMMCAEFTCKDSDDDQILLQRFCQKNEDLFIADHRSDIFYVAPSLTGPLTLENSGFTLQNGKLFYGTSTPGILHAPAYTDMDAIIDALGYPTHFRAKGESKLEYRWKFIKHFAKQILSMYWWFLLAIVFVVVGVVYRKPLAKVVKRGLKSSKKMSVQS